jgi:hypothetical protein
VGARFIAYDLRRTGRPRRDAPTNWPLPIAANLSLITRVDIKSYFQSGTGTVTELRVRLTNLFLALAFVLSAGSVLAAQTKEDDAKARFEQSSKAFLRHGGLVNVVEGQAECICANVSVSVLRAKQELTAGATIKVGAGRVEILLNPGYYLRLGPNTEARLLDLTPGNLKIKLVSGSAIVELAMDGYNSGYREYANRVFDIVTLITPRDEYAISRAGAYRLDIVSVEESKMSVLKGGVFGAGANVGEGRTASVVAGHVSVADREKGSEDAFDTWSRDRAATLVRSNKSLKRLEWYKQMHDGHAYLDVEEATSDSGGTRTISARHGLIAFVENGSTLKSGSSAWEVVEAGGTLSDGDRLRTETDSRAEINPYPYFYLLMNGNSEIRFVDSEDGDVSIEIVKGAVVLVVTETVQKARERSSLKLIAGQASFDIGREGFYRLNRPDARTAEMLIYHGAVQFNGSEIPARKRLIANGANLTRSSLDKDDINSFDVWSARRVMRNLTNPVQMRLWFAGAWYLDPSSDAYTFVPGDRYCKSPYGGNYSVTYRINRVRTLRRIETSEQPSTIRSTSPVSRPRILKSPLLRD